MRECVAMAEREGRSTGERLARLFALLHQSAAGVGPMHQDLVSETIRAAYEDDDPTRARDIHRAIEALVRAGRRQGDVTRQHAIEDLVALVIGALSQLMLEWAHREDFDVAERSARTARLLAEALAPRPGERRARG